MQMPLATVQSASAEVAAIDSQPIHTYLGWEIFISRVFKERTDKGLWLHWYHPDDRERKAQEYKFVVRYGYFIAPTQTLEAALHAASQSIDAIVELESMENERSLVPQDNRSELNWQALLSAN